VSSRVFALAVVPASIVAAVACARPLLGGLWGGKKFAPEHLDLAAFLMGFFYLSILPSAVSTWRYRLPSTKHIAALLGALMLLGAPAHAAITDDADRLIVPAGESYSLSGEHSYNAEVRIDGTLEVTPFDGASGGSLRLEAPLIEFKTTGVAATSKVIVDGVPWAGLQLQTPSGPTVGPPVAGPGIIVPPATIPGGVAAQAALAAWKQSRQEP